MLSNICFEKSIKLSRKKIEQEKFFMEVFKRKLDKYINLLALAVFLTALIVNKISSITGFNVLFCLHLDKCTMNVSLLQ